MVRARNLGSISLKSRAFIGDFVERHDILPELMAVESWDLNPEVSYTTTMTTSPIRPSKKWVRQVVPPRSPKPSAQEAHKAVL